MYNQSTINQGDIKMTKTQIVEKIQNDYTEKQTTKLDELVALDKRVKKPAQIFAYIFGTIGALILGTGMCLAMEIIGESMIAGIAIGLVGIGMVSVNYLLYKKLLKKSKDKHADKVLALSNEILQS